jgi:hypothetical protein
LRRKKPMPRILIAGATFVVGLGILMAMALREGGVETVDAAHLLSDDYRGDEVYIDAQVTDIVQKANPARFTVLGKAGGTQRVDVETEVTLSDTFEVGSDLRMKGKYDKEKKIFDANYIDTKCPSKYDGTRD